VRQLIFAIAIPLALWAWSRSGVGVEAIFAGSIYPVLGRAQQQLTGLVPFDLFEWLVVAGLAWLGSTTLASRRTSWWTWGKQIALALSLIATWFLLAWGIHYGRATLPVQQGWHDDEHVRGQPTRGEIVALTTALHGELLASWEALGPLASAEGSNNPHTLSELAAAIDRGYATLDWVADPSVSAWTSARPKRVRFLFKLFPTAGMYSPWTGEAQIDVDLPDGYAGFTACHELAHSRGFARENEANLLGYAACQAAGDPYLRYSGALAGFRYLRRAARKTHPGVVAGLNERLPPGIKADMEQGRAWARSKPDWSSALSDVTYDAYLKSQGVADGRVSYGRVVRLLVQLRRAGLLTLEGDSPS